MSAEIESDKMELFRQQLRRLYVKNRPVLTRVAAGITKNPDDAEDVLHTIYTRLLDGPPPPGFDRNPEAYLRKAVVNEAIETLRYRGRWTPMEVDSEDSQNYQSDAGSRGNEDTRRRLMDAVSQLEPETKALLALRYEVGFSPAEIAKLVGQNRTRVAMRLKRAERQLRELMSPKAVPAKSGLNGIMSTPGETQ